MPGRQRPPREPNPVLHAMLDGNERFRTRDFTRDHFLPEDYRPTSVHEPLAAVISCSDARIAAELVFDRAPGDLFMVRLAGNFVEPFAVASIEYAVAILQTPLVMVLGHTHCGAVTSAVRVILEGIEVPGHLPQLLEQLYPAVNTALQYAPTDPIVAATIENIRRQVEILKASSTLIRDAADQGVISVVGAIYDVESGEVRLLNA